MSRQHLPASGRPFKSTAGAVKSLGVRLADGDSFGPHVKRLALLFVAALSLSGCTGLSDSFGASEVSLNPSVIERRLRDEIELSSPGLFIDITPDYSCPSKMTGQPGDSWICKGRFSEVTFDVRVTLVNETGEVKFDALVG